MSETTHDASAFNAEALRDRFQAECFHRALQESAGLWRERLGGAEDVELLVADLHVSRGGWERGDSRPR